MSVATKMRNTTNRSIDYGRTGRSADSAFPRSWRSIRPAASRTATTSGTNRSAQPTQTIHCAVAIGPTGAIAPARGDSVTDRDANRRRVLLVRGRARQSDPPYRFGRVGPVLIHIDLGPEWAIVERDSDRMCGSWEAKRLAVLLPRPQSPI